MNQLPIWSCNQLLTRDCEVRVQGGRELHWPLPGVHDCQLLLQRAAGVQGHLHPRDGVSKSDLSRVVVAQHSLFPAVPITIACTCC